MNSLLDNLSPIFSELGAVLAKELLKQNLETNVIQHNENLNEEKKEVVEEESNKKEKKIENIVDDKPKESIVGKSKENIVDTITLSEDEYKNFKLLERFMNKKREKLKFLQEKVNNLIDFKKKYPGCATFNTSRRTGELEVVYTQYYHDNQRFYLNFINEETMIRQCTKNNVNVAGNIFFNNRNLTYGDYENILSAYKNHIFLEKEMSDLLKQIRDLKEELDM
jgi:hypothetical protein